MALLNLSEAAKLAKISRVTLYRAIKSGKISVTVDDAGLKHIETSELLRVYHAKGRNVKHSRSVTGLQSETSNSPSIETSKPPETPFVHSLQMEIERLKMLIAEKDTRLLDKEKHIEDMRNTVRLLEYSRRSWWKFW